MKQANIYKMKPRTELSKEIIWHPIIGEKVQVCYDGKMGRCEKGEIINKHGNSIRVKFTEWDEENKEIKAWFARVGKRSFGAIVPLPGSLMDLMFSLGGDWYSVYPVSDSE